MTAGVAVRVAEPKSRRVVAEGTELHLLDWGGGGTPLLLLPGMGQSAHIFRALVPFLGGRFRALAVSPRAHGESDSPETGYTLASFTADVRAVMDALEIGRAAVVGHSFGGAVATRLAAEAPERVSHLVYLDSLTDYRGVARIAARAPVRPPVLPPGASDVIERAWHRAFTYGLWNEAVEADWRARPDAAVRRHRRELLTDLLDDLVHSREPFMALRCPALALMAQESVSTQFPWLKADDPRRAEAEAYLRKVRIPWRHASAERFRREARHARVAEVPGNHFFFLSAPQRTAAEIRGFLHSA